MSLSTKDDDDFGEEVYTGRVKAATLPMGGPASRRVKREVEGGPIAKGLHLISYSIQSIPHSHSVRRVPDPLRPLADPGLCGPHPGHAPPLPCLLHQGGPGMVSCVMSCSCHAVSCPRNTRESSYSDWAVF